MGTLLFEAEGFDTSEGKSSAKASAVKAGNPGQTHYYVNLISGGKRRACLILPTIEQLAKMKEVLDKQFAVRTGR